MHLQKTEFHHLITWQTYLEQNKNRYIAELFEFIRIPSVSALDVHIPDVQKAAEWVVEKLEEAGIEQSDCLHAPCRWQNCHRGLL